MKGVFWKGVFFCNPAGIHISESIERMIAEGLSYSEISRKQYDIGVTGRNWNRQSIRSVKFLAGFYYKTEIKISNTIISVTKNPCDICSADDLYRQLNPSCSKLSFCYQFNKIIKSHPFIKKIKIQGKVYYEGFKVKSIIKL